MTPMAVAVRGDAQGSAGRADPCEGEVARGELVHKVAQLRAARPRAHRGHAGGAAGAQRVRLGSLHGLQGRQGVLEAQVREGQLKWVP